MVVLAYPAVLGASEIVRLAHECKRLGVGRYYNLVHRLAYGLELVANISVFVLRLLRLTLH